VVISIKIICLLACDRIRFDRSDRFTVLSVYCFIGLLVYWFIGLLVCQFIGLAVYWYVG